MRQNLLHWFQNNNLYCRARNLNLQAQKQKAQKVFLKANGPTIFGGFAKQSNSFHLSMRSFQVGSECIVHTLLKGDAAFIKKYTDITEEFGFLASDYAKTNLQRLWQHFFYYEACDYFCYTSHFRCVYSSYV